MTETRTIQLTQGQVAIVDAADYEWLSQYKWHAFCNQGGKWYAARGVRLSETSNTVYMHRAILGAPSDMEIDHINGEGLDNRRENLRLALIGQNRRNARKRKDNTSGYKGVYYDKERDKWCANIHFEHKAIFLGRFDTPKDAAYAYDAAAKELHGEFAQLNFP